jgi:uncharacterized protein (DUF3084 family)
LDERKVQKDRQIGQKDRQLVQKDRQIEEQKLEIKRLHENNLGLMGTISLLDKGKRRGVK